MSPLLVLPLRLPDLPPTAPAPAPDRARPACVVPVAHPVRADGNTPGATRGCVDAEVDPVVGRALALSARVLSPDHRLPRTRWGIARLRWALARDLRGLRVLAVAGSCPGRAGEVAARASRLLAGCRGGQGFGAVIAVVRCAEEVRELAFLAHPHPERLRVLRAASRTGTDGGVWSRTPVCPAAA